MEGATPSDGSPSCGDGSTGEREVASLGFRARLPVRRRPNATGTPWLRPKGRSGSKPEAIAQAIVGLRPSLSAPFVQRMSRGLHVASSNLVESSLRARSSEVEPSSPQFLSLLLPSTPRKWGTSLVKRTRRVQLPQTAPRRMPVRIPSDCLSVPRGTYLHVLCRLVPHPLRSRGGRRAS
jgi:hypothetical protein